jgi:hypothetical protein
MTMTNRSKQYQNYLDSPAWKQRKGRLLHFRGNICELCRATDRPLDLHHLTYARFGNELDTDLLLLCRPCHTLWHLCRRGRPTKKLVDYVVKTYGVDDTFWPLYVEHEFYDLSYVEEVWIWED